MRSEDRSQLELLSERAEPYVEKVTPEFVERVVRKARTLSAAWAFAQDHAALDDKQCYDVLQMDSSHWSKIRKGTAWPPTDARWNRYMDLLKNEIPLIYAVESRGYDFLSLRRHCDDKDKYIAELERKVAVRDEAIALMMHAQKGRA